MKKSIFTFGGELEIITLKEFLKRVQVAEIKEHKKAFNTQIKSYTPYIIEEEGVVHIEEECLYSRRLAYLSSLTPSNAAQIALGLQAHHGMVFYHNPVEMLEDAIIQHLEFFGDSKYAVRIAPRMWMIADPDDFMLYCVSSNVNVYALACLYEARTFVKEVSRITAKEVLKMVQDKA